MYANLEGKVVLVTGSSKGIGFAIARAFNNIGSRVILNGRNLQLLENASRQLNNSFFVCADVVDPIAAQNLITKVYEIMGRIDILICNVGSGKSVCPGQETYSEWQRVFANNLWSTTNVVEHALPYLILSRGVIVCISSICGLETIPGAPVTYSAAKAALHAYVRGVSRPLGDKGVRINAVAPGNILFPGSVWDEKLKDSPEKTRKMIAENTPLNKFGTVDDIARIVLYLSSAEADFVTGKVWAVDGGFIRG